MLKLLEKQLTDKHKPDSARTDYESKVLSDLPQICYEYLKKSAPVDRVSGEVAECLTLAVRLDAESTSAAILKTAADGNRLIETLM